MTDKLIRVSAASAVCVLALIAFSISWQHIYDVALMAGQSPEVAQLYPVTVDGLLICSALVGLYCSRCGLPTPPLARVGLAMGIGATVACNVAEGISHGLGAALFAGWPAAALLVASEMVLWLVARSVDTAAVVVIEKTDQADQLRAVVELLAVEPRLSAAELSRRMPIRYDDARALVKQARELMTN